MLKRECRILPCRTENFGGDLFFDFGRDAFAVLRIEAEAECGQEITLAVGEVLLSGRIHREPGGSRIYQEQTVRLEPGSNRIDMTMFHPGYNQGTLPVEPNAVPFRYAEVRGFRGTRLRAVQRAFFGAFDDAASDFRSSSPALDRIWEFCKYTMKATSLFGVFIDGNRERQAYEGDTLVNQLSWFACEREPEIARRTIDRLFEYPTWPTEWRLAMIPVVHDYLLYTGDMENVLRWYEPLKRKNLLSGVREDGLLEADRISPEEKLCPGFGASGKVADLIDWPPGERDGYEIGPVNLVPNCWQYMALCRSAEIADLTGRNTDAGFFRAAARRSRAAIRRTMFKNGFFVDNPDSDHIALHSCIFPVLWNVAEDSEKGPILKKMLSRGMACSVFIAQFLLECCYRNGLAAEALARILSGGLRSWNNMLAKGATITMEAWDDSFKPNQDWNHPWGAAPANIIVRHLCGIRPVEPGFRTFAVDPRPGPLTGFFLRTPTPSGSVELEMREPGRYRLLVPEGTRAVYGTRIFSAGVHHLQRQ